VITAGDVQTVAVCRYVNMKDRRAVCVTLVIHSLH